MTHAPTVVTQHLPHIVYNDYQHNGVRCHNISSIIVIEMKFTQWMSWIVRTWNDIYAMNELNSKNMKWYLHSEWVE